MNMDLSMCNLTLVTQKTSDKFVSDLQEFKNCHIEDLTRVAISYGIYETSLRRISIILYVMTMRVTQNVILSPSK